MLTSAAAITAAPTASSAAELDEDTVVFDFSTNQKIESSFQGAATTQGYTLFPGIHKNAFVYTVRLIASARVEQYRSSLQSVADELNAAGLAKITVAPGVFPEVAAPGANEVLFRAASTSPCGSSGYAGCGAPSASTRADGSDLLAIAGSIWILPITDGYSAANKRHVVAHELGHALGLQHHSPLFNGSYQMMHPSAYDATAYRAGDKAGLAFLGQDVLPVGTIDSVTSVTPGKVRVTGWAFDPDGRSTATVRLTVDGATAAQIETSVRRQDVEKAQALPYSLHGFDLTIAVAIGVHSLCLTTANFPRSTFAQTGSCRAVTPSGGFTTSRLQGSDRFESAVAVSRATYPSTAPWVVLATGESFPDALAGGPIATKLGGPLLLTSGSALPASTAAEISRLKPSRVLLAGGTASIADSVVAAVQKLGTTVTRVGGGDRYETSHKLARFAFSSASTAFVASGDTFPDALAAGAAAAASRGPLLLVGAPGSPADAAAAAVATGLKVTKSRVVGGTAVIGEATVTKLRSVVPDTKRLSGADRFLTAVAVSQDTLPAASTDRAHVVNGMNFPDGLVATPLAAMHKGPVFLSPGWCVPRESVVEMTRLGAKHLTLVGGTTALSAEVAATQMCS